MKPSKSDIDEKRSSYKDIAAYLAAASATGIQTTGTHVLDTASKRLQNSKNVKFSLVNIQQAVKNVYSIIYPTSTSSMWDGFSAALTYRLMACTFTLGTQPLIHKYLNKEHGATIIKLTGEQYLSTATHMLSGAMCGLIEVAFMPLDRWKVLRQLNNTTPIFRLMKQERTKLYDGSLLTGLRNVYAYSALFGVSDMCQQYFSSGSQEAKTSIFYQRMISSCAGSVAAVIMSNPADVIKTALQAQTYASTLTKPGLSIKIAAKIYQQDGMHGFMRGVVPRLVGIVPRLTLLKALSEEFTPMIHKGLEHGADWVENFLRKP
jgi:hypothetical protein